MNGMMHQAMIAEVKQHRSGHSTHQLKTYILLCIAINLTQH
jgi:hypothetical protein